MSVGGNPVGSPEGEPATRGFSYNRHLPRVRAFRHQRAIGFDGILERRRKRMLRSKPTVDTEYLGAGGLGEAPNEVAVEHRRARHVAAAMEVEHGPPAARFRSNDRDRFDPIEIDAPHPRILRRCRHKSAETCKLLSPCIKRRLAPALALEEETQPQAQELGAQTHRRLLLS